MGFRSMRSAGNVRKNLHPARVRSDVNLDGLSGIERFGRWQCNGAANGEVDRALGIADTEKAETWMEQCADACNAESVEEIIDYLVGEFGVSRVEIDSTLWSTVERIGRFRRRERIPITLMLIHVVGATDSGAASPCGVPEQVGSRFVTGTSGGSIESLCEVVRGSVCSVRDTQAGAAVTLDCGALLGHEARVAPPQCNPPSWPNEVDLSDRVGLPCDGYNRMRRRE